LAERDRLGLEPLVKFAGHRRDVPEDIASSDALMVTSFREGFPNVVLEAMACRTAVISTDYDARRLGQLVRHGQEKLPEQSVAVAEAISSNGVAAVATHQPAPPPRAVLSFHDVHERNWLDEFLQQWRPVPWLSVCRRCWPTMRGRPWQDRLSHWLSRAEDRQGTARRDRGARAEGGEDPRDRCLFSPVSRASFRAAGSASRQPQVFLFDEPLSNLDAKLHAQTRLEIQKLHDECDRHRR
jgi:hypothetical protein